MPSVLLRITGPMDLERAGDGVEPMRDEQRRRRSRTASSSQLRVPWDEFCRNKPSRRTVGYVHRVLFIFPVLCDRDFPPAVLFLLRHSDMCARRVSLRKLPNEESNVGSKKCLTHQIALLSSILSLIILYDHS